MRLCIQARGPSTSLRATLCVVGILTAFASALPVRARTQTGQPEPGFDPKEVVRQVHTRRDMTELRSGDSDRVPSRQRNRVPSHPSAEGRERSAVSGERFTDDGEFLIDTNSTLAPAPYNQVEPAIAFDGANFLVVWEDYRSGSDCDVYGARVTPAGTVLDPQGFVISQAA